MTASEKTFVKDLIDNLIAAGDTTIGGGLLQARAEFESSGLGQGVGRPIILITDGRNDSPPSPADELILD